MTKFPRRVVAAFACAAALIVLAASPALAHEEIDDVPHRFRRQLALRPAGAVGLVARIGARVDRYGHLEASLGQREPQVAARKSRHAPRTRGTFGRIR